MFWDMLTRKGMSARMTASDYVKRTHHCNEMGNGLIAIERTRWVFFVTTDEDPQKYPYRVVAVDKQTGAPCEILLDQKEGEPYRMELLPPEIARRYEMKQC